MPEDFFVDIISCNNFLVMALTNLFTNIKEYEANNDLKSKAISFENHLSKKFGWCFDDEIDDEYSPVVVQLWINPVLPLIMLVQQYKQFKHYM